LEWTKLLSNQRLGKAENGDTNVDRTFYQVDYDRIVFSSAFRRLQDKTQVFPLAQSDYVRTRLTHSMEVSCIARTLGIKVGHKLLDKGSIKNIHPSDIGTILATAALAHDLGNPPFGHSGEDGIRHWFQNSSVANSIKSKLSDKELQDINHYEGNAQGFRLLSRLEMPDNTGGMQLTYATLASFVKYPVESSLLKSSDSICVKKFNFFQSEKELFREVAEGVGLIKTSDTQYAWCRHPLAFLVEAADDICYRIVDFEDGYRLGLIEYNEIYNLFSNIIGEGNHQNTANGLKEKRNRIEYLRAKALNKLVEEITGEFVKRESQLLKGEFNQSLISVIPSYKYLKALKDRAMEDVYSARSVVEIEVAGFEVARGLLDLFVSSALEYTEKKEKCSSKTQKIMALMPGSKKLLDADSTYEKLLQIFDFFSGMTDSYAVSLFKKVTGISLPQS
jgi:dGTPase